jgi:hypothetical protein
MSLRPGWTTQQDPISNKQIYNKKSKQRRLENYCYERKKKKKMK